jgi:hypothetical protein
MRLKDAGTQKDDVADSWNYLWKARGGSLVKYGLQNTYCRRREQSVPKDSNSRWREKLLLSMRPPVPQTDTGR